MGANQSTVLLLSARNAEFTIRQLMLENAGYHVMAARTVDALAVLSRSDVDVVIVDEDQAEVAMEILARGHRAVPLLLVGESGEECDGCPCEQVSKTGGPAALLDAIARLTRRNKARAISAGH